MPKKYTDQLKLNAGQIEAMQYKFEGYSYTKISEMLHEIGYEIPVSTLKYWFMPTGPLAPLYREYANDERTLRLDEARDMFRAHVKNAASVLASCMMHPNPIVRIAAAKAVLAEQKGILKNDEQREEKNLEDAATRILKSYGVLDIDGNFHIDDARGENKTITSDTGPALQGGA